MRKVKAAESFGFREYPRYSTNMSYNGLAHWNSTSDCGHLHFVSLCYRSWTRHKLLGINISVFSTSRLWAPSDFVVVPGISLKSQSANGDYPVERQGKPIDGFTPRFWLRRGRYPLSAILVIAVPMFAKIAPIVKWGKFLLHRIVEDELSREVAERYTMIIIPFDWRKCVMKQRCSGNVANHQLLDLVIYLQSIQSATLTETNIRCYFIIFRRPSGAVYSDASICLRLFNALITLCPKLPSLPGYHVRWLGSKYHYNYWRNKWPCDNFGSWKSQTEWGLWVWSHRVDHTFSITPITSKPHSIEEDSIQLNGYL